MTFSRTLLSTLIASSLLFACSEDDDETIVVDPAPPTPTLQQPTLTTPAIEMTLPGNAFVTPCLAYTMLDLNSLKRDVSFDANGNYSTKDEIFLGDSCGDFPYLTLETSGTYVDGGKSSSDQTLMNIDFTQTDSYLTVGTERIQTTFNANAYCGKSDWKIGERVALSSVSCDFVPNNNGLTTSDVYTFEESSLYFGANFSTMAKAGVPRPTSVDRNVKFGNANLEAL